MFNLSSLVPSARNFRTQQQPSTRHAQPARASRPIQEPAPTLRMAMFRSGPEQRQHYFDCVFHAVKCLDVRALSDLLANPRNVGRLTRMVAVNNKVPEGFPGGRPGDSLLHVLADRSDDPVKAAQMIAILQTYDADPNAVNHDRETPAMRAAASSQIPQLTALATTPLFDSTIRRPVRSGNSLHMETLWNQVVRTRNVEAMRFLEALTSPPIDCSPPVLIPDIDDDGDGEDDGVLEGPPPAYGSNVGLRRDNADVLPPQAWTSDPPPRAWLQAGKPPAYWSTPPYSARDTNASEARIGDPLTRRFSDSEVVHRPLGAARFRRSSTGSNQPT